MALLPESAPPPRAKAMRCAPPLQSQVLSAIRSE
jgi:hypothetical protein